MCVMLFAHIAGVNLKQKRNKDRKKKGKKKMGTLARAEINSLTLKERLELKKKTPCFLLDISGSMSSDVEPGHRKIDVLREVISGIIAPKIVFSDHAEFVDTVPEPCGGTYMSKAIILAKEKGYKVGIMVTDGANDHHDEDKALKAIKGFNLQIIYVGLGNRPEFLDKLANASGGYASTEDLKQPKELTERLLKLLGPGAGERKIEL